MRRTLNCGHMDLVQIGLAGRSPEEIGKQTPCYVCPKRSDAGYPAGHGPQVATIRQVVILEPITLERHPEPLAVEWWYW